jgi:hypothetical protein
MKVEQERFDLKAIMEEWYTKLWNKRDPSVIEKYADQESTLHGHGDAPLSGPEAFYALQRQLCDIFSEIKVTVLQDVAEGLTYSSRNRAEFVHTSTGKKATIQFASMVIFSENGKVREAWDTVDWYALLVQMDALPADALTQTLTEDRSFR